MNTDLAQRQTTEIVDVEIDQGAILNYLGLRRDDPAAQAAVLLCQRYNLDPILKHVVLIEENAKNKETDQWEKVGRVYITRDGLLHNAHNSGHLDGIEEIVAPHLNPEGTHWVARVAVHRDDMKRPFSYTGRFPAKRWRGKRGEKVEEDHPYGPEMAIKVSECMSLRRAFNISAPSAEERWDRAEVQEATVIDHVEQTGGLAPWVNALIDEYGADTVRAATGVDFLEQLTDEAAVRSAISEHLDPGPEAPQAEEPVAEPEPEPQRPQWADRHIAHHGKQLLLDAINDVRDAAEPRKDPVDSLDEVKWNGIGEVTKKLIDDAVKRRSERGEESSSDNATRNPGSTTPAQQEEGEAGPQSSVKQSPAESTASPHSCPECGAECVEGEGKINWECPNGDFKSYHEDPWKPDGEVERALRRKAHTDKERELYEVIDSKSAKDVIKSVGTITDRKTLEMLRKVEGDRPSTRVTVIEKIDEQLKSPEVTGAGSLPESEPPGAERIPPDSAPASGLWDAIEQHVAANLTTRKDVLRKAVTLAIAAGITFEQDLTFERVADLPASILADIIEDLGLTSNVQGSLT